MPIPTRKPNHEAYPIGTIFELQGYHISDRCMVKVREVCPTDRVWISDHQGGGHWANGQYLLESVVYRNEDVTPDLMTLAFDDLEDHLCEIHEDSLDTCDLAEIFRNQACERFEQDMEDYREAKANMYDR